MCRKPIMVENLAIADVEHAQILALKVSLPKRAFRLLASWQDVPISESSGS